MWQRENTTSTQTCGRHINRIGLPFLGAVLMPGITLRGWLV